MPGAARRPAVTQVTRHRSRTESLDGDMAKITITIPTDVFDQVEEVARLEDRSMSGMITRLCRTALAQYDATERVQPRTPDDEAAWRAVQRGTKRAAT